MGRRGPAPQPTALRILHNNPGKRPFNKREPQPERGRPPCPRWLTAEARKEWKRVVPELDRLGLLTIVDRAGLATYCQAWARYVEAEAMLTQYGSILKSKNSDYIQVSPYATISKQNALLVKAFCQEFGLTPSSRTRLAVPKNEKEPDALEEWMRNGNRN
jgi:P27 family predicted phage terminase small subunit